eukprot:5983799-Pyramimonas_sp.AAC.1
MKRCIIGSGAVQRTVVTRTTTAAPTWRRRRGSTMRRARPCGSAAHRAAPTPALSSMQKSSQCTYISAASPPHPAMPRVSSACSGMARG